MRHYTIAIIAVAALLAGCSSGLSKQEVQSMIDKSIANALTAQQQQQPAEVVPEPDPAFQPPPAATGPNAEVDSDLNNADLAFRDKQEDNGCTWVSNAITSARRAPVSEDQARQLRDYAQRCRLRY